MKREYYAKRFKDAVKIYGTTLNFFNDVSWGYVGKIARKHNEELYYFVPSMKLSGVNESLIYVIKKEIDYLKSKRRVI